MATYTSTMFNNPAKELHIANSTQSGQLLFTAVSSVGDFGFLYKVPHGAKIVDFYEYHTSGATAQSISFGFDRGIAAGGGGNASCLIASGAQATMNRLSLANSGQPGNAPNVISLSDLDPIRYAILTAKVESGTGTSSLFINSVVTYRRDGPDAV